MTSLTIETMVRSFLSILATRQNNILSGAFVLMVAVFGSKFLGLIRDRLLVHNFNTTEASIFFGAFKLPDLLFQLIVFGALSVAFIPVFTDLLNKKGEKEAFAFASNILNLFLLVFGLVAILAFIFVAPLNNILVPGFSGEHKALTDQLSRLIMVAQMLLVVGSFFIAMAQSYQSFIISSLAPLFYNLGVIIGIAVFSPFLGILGPAIGIVIGAFLHMSIQYPFIRSLGFRHKFSFDFLNPGVQEVFKLMSVRNIGLFAEQVSDTVGIALASLVSYSSVTLLTFAQHLQVVPVGLFGATIAQAALPILSRESSKGEMELFKITLLTTVHQILFLSLPAAVILIVLRIPVVRLVFGASQFNWNDTVLTGLTVAYFSLGLTAHALVLLFVRAFYALKDTKTPVLVSLVSVSLNITLSFIFIKLLKMDVWSLGLSYAITTNISLGLFVYFIHHKVGGFNLQSLLLPAIKMVVAASLSAVALYLPMKALDQLIFDTTRTVNLIILTGIASFFGLSVYIVLVWLLKVHELHTFVNIIKRVYKVRLEVKPDEVVGGPGV